MKISKATLHQIIREEARSLVEAPSSNRGPSGTEPMTRYDPRKGRLAKRRDKDREAVKDFFGSDDPLVTKADDPRKTHRVTEPAVDPDKTIARSPEEMAARAAELDAAEPGDIELKKIYLLSRFHCGDTAARLLTSTIDGAAGHSRLLLGVKDDNHRAIGFYAKHGFRQIATRRFDVGGTLYDDVVLARDLEQV